MRKLTMQGGRILSRYLPIWVSDGLHGCTTQISIRRNHSEEASLFPLRSARCRPIYPATKRVESTLSIPLLPFVGNWDTNRTHPVFFEILTWIILVSVGMFKRCPPNENLKESYSQSPDVRFASTMWQSSSTLGRKVLDIKNAGENMLWCLVTTYLRSSIWQIKMECGIRCHVVFLGKTKINKNRNILGWQKNASRSITIRFCERLNSESEWASLLDVIVHYASFV